MQSGLKIALKLFNKREYEIKFELIILSNSSIDQSSIT